jgi:hypothetical protein
MKTHPREISWKNPAGHLPILGVLLTLAAMPAIGAPDAAPSEPMPYTLYLGVDLDVQQGREFCRVQGVAGSRLIARVDGKMESIPTDESPISLRVRPAIKVQPSSTTVTLADLKVDRRYTAGNDPVRKFVRQHPGSSGVQQYDIAQGDAIDAAVGAGAVSADALPQIRQEALANMNAAAQRANTVLGQVSTDRIYDTSDYAAKMGEELARKLFDAIEVTFKVSSPEPLTRPYVVIIAQYHEPGAPPKTIRNWIYAQELEPINSQPHKVTIFRGGFTKGFELKGCQIHLFDHGRELATTESRNRKGLTRDEAFDFRLVDYLGSHQGKNVPATPAMAAFPAGLRDRLTPVEFQQTYYVKVTKDGRPLGAYLDQACRTRLGDAALVAAIEQMRFLPALLDGHPVPGVSQLRLDLGTH